MKFSVLATVRLGEMGSLQPHKPNTLNVCSRKPRDLNSSHLFNLWLQAPRSSLPPARYSETGDKDGGTMTRGPRVCHLEKQGTSLDLPERRWRERRDNL